MTKPHVTDEQSHVIDEQDLVIDGHDFDHRRPESGEASCLFVSREHAPRATHSKTRIAAALEFLQVQIAGYMPLSPFAFPAEEAARVAHSYPQFSSPHPILDIHKGYGENSLDGIVDEINRALAANSTETASNG
jgi:hypothetical protein